MVAGHGWVTEIECALQRIKESHHVIEVSLRRVQADYRFIAETIKSAISADSNLSQKQIAQSINKSATWVSRLLLWHTKGCISGSPFGDEIAARRKAKQLEDRIATSQSEEITADADLGQGSFFDCTGNYMLDCAEATFVRGRAEATFKAMSLMGACHALENAANVDRTTLALVRSSAIDERVFTLEKLETNLNKSIAAGNRALEEVRAARNDIPKLLEAAE